jgi:DNA-binding transcriptional MerR regulator/methylmalonyl-CoA mutase cobalamin-binding subunit
MTEIDTKTESQETALYPIRTVSDLTDVNAITLRAWERRYGLFEPVRKASGHRLYTQEHIDLITRVVGLLDRGMRIGQVKAQLDAEAKNKTAVLTTGANVVLSDAWRRYVESMMAAVIQFNELGLEEIYSNALSLYPMDEVTEKLLMPLLHELGRRWEQGEGSIAEEHFFGFYIRNKLGARFHHRPKSKTGPRILLSCLPGDRHETGLLLFALAASSAGYQTILLGADMPLEDLPAVAAKTGARAIILSGILQPGSEVLKQALPRLAGQSDAPVFVGGHASVKVHDALKRVGIKVLGTDMQTGLARLCEVVPVG